MTAGHTGEVILPSVEDGISHRRNTRRIDNANDLKARDEQVVGFVAEMTYNTVNGDNLTEDDTEIELNSRLDTLIGGHT